MWALFGAATAALILFQPWTGVIAWAAYGGVVLALGLLVERGSAITLGQVPARPTTEVQSPPRVSVVIPALDEAGNLRQVLRRLPGGLHEVILVDGGSTDRTVEVARASLPSIRVLHQSGRGKGDALKQGFDAVTGDVVVMLDADGSADPAEIPRFVDCLNAGADFAKGTRFADGGGSDDITKVRRLGNGALVGIVNLLYGTRFSDLCYGYNAFWTSCLPHISLDAPGFEVETLINLRMAKSGMRIHEVPSYELARQHGDSHLKPVRDGLRVLRTILREFRLGLGVATARRPVAADSGRASPSPEIPG